MFELIKYVLFSKYSLATVGLNHFFKSQPRCSQWIVHLSSNFSSCPERLCEVMIKPLEKTTAARALRPSTVHELFIYGTGIMGLGWLVTGGMKINYITIEFHKSKKKWFLVHMVRVYKCTHMLVWLLTNVHIFKQYKRS